MKRFLSAGEGYALLRTSIVLLFLLVLWGQGTAQGQTESIADLLTQKIDAPRVPYQREYPFLINANGGDGSTLLFHSVLAGFQPGLKSWRIAGHKVGDSKKDSIGGYRVSVINNPLLSLFQSAYYKKGQLVRYNKQNTILDVQDPTPFTFPFIADSIALWSEKYVFSYEAIVPYAAGVDALYDTFQHDLRRFFPQYASFVERRLMDCLVLVRTSDEDKLKSKDGKSFVESNVHYLEISNNYLNRLIQRLGGYYMQHADYPIVDGTGYVGRVDLVINARLNDLEEVNSELARYDLRFVIQPREIDVLVIRDAPGKPLDLAQIRMEQKAEPNPGLKVGDILPALDLQHIHGYHTGLANTRDFQGKLLILDFWATWCTPCVAMMPRLEKLQQQFKDRLQVLSVTYQSAEEVLPFLDKAFGGRAPALVKVTDEKMLHQFFPHRILPHFVWIGPEGKVLAFTGQEELTASKIEQVLSSLDDNGF